MTLHFKNLSIDTSIFETEHYARDLDIISFHVTEGICESSISLNLVFRSPQDARRAYFTMLREMSDEVDLRDIEVEWPSALVDRIMGVLYEPELFKHNKE
jgi:hypothetical protein